MKFKHLLLVAFVAILSSCETNENPNLEITSDDLLGAWDVTALNLDLSTSATVQNVTATSTSKTYGKDFDFIYTFSENPNEITAVGSYTSVTTTSIPGEPDDTQEIRVSSIDGLDSGNWSLEGNILTLIDNNNQSSSAEITSFSGNKLTLKQFVDETVDVLGTIVTIKGEMLLTLER